MAQTAAIRNRHRTPRCYLQHALGHYTQAIVVVTAASLAVLTLSWVLPLALMLVGQAMLVLLLPLSRSFRRGVDERLDLLERASAVEVRAALLGRLTAEHRSELATLEGLAAEINARTGQTGSPVGAADDEWLGVDKLLGAYVQVALASRASDEMLRAVDRRELERQVTMLEAQHTAATDVTRLCIDHRLTVTRRRLITAQQVREDRARLAHRLAAIAELVRWMHEETLAARAQLLDTELNEVLTSCEESGQTLRELSALCAGLEEVDPRTLALGRAAPAHAVGTEGPPPPANRARIAPDSSAERANDRALAREVQTTMPAFARL